MDMSCNTKPAPKSKCGDIKRVTLIRVKPYVYEMVNGKRKRVSPFTIVDGVVTEIKERAIIEIIRS